MKAHSTFLKALYVFMAVLLVSIVYWYSFQRQVTLPEMTVQEKKERFRDLVVPAVNKVHKDLMKQYRNTSDLLQSGGSAKKIEKLKKEYGVTSDEQLLMALKPHHRSITIAQAAMESSWATSRIFLEANNMFGVWSFDENEPRLAALQKREGKTVWVKKYPSIDASIRDYYRTLARGDAFKDFRMLKMKTSDPYKLVTKLDRYSEKGGAYGEELATIIRVNNFDTYDSQDGIEP